MIVQNHPLDHAFKIAKMSISYAAADTTVNVVLLYVVQDIPVPSTIGAGLFKPNKTGDMITLEQYLKDITLEIKTDVKRCLKRILLNIEILKMSIYNHKC